MPSVKIPKKSTFVDMTPFVDVAFLILTFFIMATKFKPPDPVEVTTPKSVSTAEIPESNAILITIDKDGKVYFTVLSENNTGIYTQVINSINSSRNLNLSPAEIANYRKTYLVGVGFGQLKQLLDLPANQQKNLQQPGMPVDTTGGDLTYWIQAAKSAFAGEKLQYMVKGDNMSKYPVFKNVINALKANDEYRYNLITAMRDAPAGTELYQERHRANK
ncbi:MAG TPA: biopolymer transporter ExbD [Chitinophagaceae bacterium]